MAKTHIKTSTGFEADIDESVIDDFELLCIVCEMDKNPIALKSVLDKLLPAEERARLMEYDRNEDGRVPTSVITREIIDLFNGLNKAKKS